MMLKISIENIMLEILNEVGLPFNVTNLNLLMMGYSMLKSQFCTITLKRLKRFLRELKLVVSALMMLSLLLPSLLDALKVIYDFEFHDYNYKDLILLKKNSYAQAFGNLHNIYVECQSQFQSLQASYASLASKFKKLRKKYQRLSKVLKKIKAFVGDMISDDLFNLGGYYVVLGVFLLYFYFELRKDLLIFCYGFQCCGLGV